MRFLFACGGSGGHINPAVAIAGYIKARHPNYEILFVGNPSGIEVRLVKQAGFKFAPISIQGFQRRVTWYNFKYNIRTMRYLCTCGKKVKKILDDFKPDIVIGTGGYISGPVLRKASQLGYKTVTHESNVFPGITTKLLIKYVDKVLLASEDTKKHLPYHPNFVVTGNPIKEDFIFKSKEEARKELNIGDEVCILSFGGSLGARQINLAIAHLMKWHTEKGNIHHIHSTGSHGAGWFEEILDGLGVDYTNNKNLDIREYIDNMPTCFAAADLIICRSGAMTLNEIQTVGRASLLIPSPNVAENHQFHNAMALAKRNAAIVIEEKDLTKEKLCKAVEKLVNNKDDLVEFGKNAQKLAIIDANDRIYKEIFSLM